MVSKEFVHAGMIELYVHHIIVTDHHACIYFKAFCTYVHLLLVQKTGTSVAWFVLQKINLRPGHCL